MDVSKAHPLESQQYVIWQAILSELRVNYSGGADNEIGAWCEVILLDINFLDRPFGAGSRALPAINADTFYAGGPTILYANGLCGTRLHAQNASRALPLVNLNVIGCLGIPR
jgi:hypothetical protein